MSETLKPIFSKVNAEWESPSCNLPLLPFLMYVHAFDTKSLTIHVTDFQSYTWESTKSLQDLEDLREEAGIGGSWSDFVNYMMDSIKSNDVKLVLGVPILSSSSAKGAKLVAQKAEGMPLITFYLKRLLNSSASDAITNLSWEIFKAFQSAQELLVKEQKCSYGLTEKLSALEEKNESMQNRLSFVMSSKKQKLSKLVESDKTFPIPTPLIDLDTLEASHVTNSQAGQPTKEVSPSMKASPLVPEYRRKMVEGIFLDDRKDGNPG